MSSREVRGTNEEHKEEHNEKKGAFFFFLAVLIYRYLPLLPLLPSCVDAPKYTLFFNNYEEPNV